MSHVLRRGALVVVPLMLALAPVAAFAEDGNQAAIDAAKAEKAALQNMPRLEEGVTLGQREIANAHAIAAMLSFDGHAQLEIPNSMQQYSAFCQMAIGRVQANLTNATAMATARPWDMHAQAELANATTSWRMLWDTIGDTYPGNPYPTLEVPTGAPAYTAQDDGVAVGGDDELAATDDGAFVATDDAVADAGD